MIVKNHFPYRRKQGFTVFEVMLALAIFSLVMVSLAVALEKTMDAFVISKKESLIRQNLESHLSQVRQQPLQVGTQSLGQDNDGVDYESEVKPLELTNQRNVTLVNLYQLIIRARWVENGTKEERLASIYVYQP